MRYLQIQETKHRKRFGFLSLCVCVCVCVAGWVGVRAQSCLTLCDSMDCSPPGSSVHGVLQARILKWVATFCSRGFSRPRDPNCSLLDWQVDSLPLSHLGSPFYEYRVYPIQMLPPGSQPFQTCLLSPGLSTVTGDIPTPLIS